MQITIKNHQILFDDDFSPLILSNKWRVAKNKNIFYAIGDKTSMHRLILNAPPFSIVDHINGNGLDNRISNLRFTTPQGNKANSHHGKYTSSFIGVSKITDVNRKKQFRVMAKKNCKKIHLGYFEFEIDAAKAYDSHAKNIYGDLAITNF